MSEDAGRASENRRERRSFKAQLLDRLDALRLKPFDVLVLHLPREVIEDRGLFEQARQGAIEVMEAARRPVLLLPEGTKITAEDVEPFLREMGFESPAKEPPAHLPFDRPTIQLPDKHIIRGTPEQN